MAKQPPLRSAAEVQLLINAQGESDAALTDNTAFNAEISYLLKKEVLASLQQNNRERLRYAKWTFVLTCFWIFVVMILVFMNGYHPATGSRPLQLSDTIVVTLISTTTINVFGFFLLVIKFLFNTGELAALTALFSNDAKPKPAPEA